MEAVYEDVNEPIEAAVVFRKGRAEPVAFKWRKSFFKIERINLRHQSRIGRDLIYSYSISTEGEGNFKISFNPNLLLWNLDQIYN